MIKVFEFDQELMNEVEKQQMSLRDQEQLVIDNTMIYHHLWRIKEQIHFLLTPNIQSHPISRSDLL